VCLVAWAIFQIELKTLNGIKKCTATSETQKGINLTKNGT
jgi:hypothetical protein